MVAILRSAVIDAPIDTVWRLLRDFNSHHLWHPAVAESEIEGWLPSDQTGCVRRFTLIATDLEPTALKPGMVRDEAIKAIEGHAKAATGLIGLFKNPY